MAGGAGVEQGPTVHGVVPLISSVDAGRPRERVDNYLRGSADVEMIPTSVPVNRHTFALRVVGDSMEPEFSEGMILIIEPELAPQAGDFVIAVNGDEESTFKQLVKDGPDWYLKPVNPRYPIKPLSGSRVVGVVRAVERRFR